MRPPRRIALTILLALALGVYFIALGDVSIWDANEAFYVETPREMIEAHDYINPSFNYLPRFNKPVLSYWIVAFFYKLFGVSVGVQRLPIALGAVVIVACAFVLGRIAVGDRGAAGGARGDPSTVRRAHGRPEQGRGTTSSGSSRPSTSSGRPEALEGRAKSRDEAEGAGTAASRAEERSITARVASRGGVLERGNAEILTGSAGLGTRANELATAGQGLAIDAGLFAAVGLAAAPRLVMFARRIFIDIWITAFLSLTLTFFALSERYPARRRQYLLLMYVSIGLGALTKGPVAVAIPLLGFGLYLLVTRELHRMREMMIPLGLLIIAVIVVPWYALLYHEHGWSYISSFFVNENLERYTSGFGVRQRRGLLFYLPVIFSDSFPISAFLFGAAVIWRRERARVQTLLWCWIVAIVAFFSLSAGKQDLYIFPIVAAVAALGGVAIIRGACEPAWRQWLRGTLLLTGVLLAAAAVAVLWLFEAGGHVYALEGALTVGICGLIGGALVLAFAMARRCVAAVLTLLLSLILIDYAFVARVLPDFERYKPVPALAAILHDRAGPDDIVANYQVALPSMVYYLQRHVEEYFDEEPFVRAFLSQRRMYAVISEEDYNALSPVLGSRACVLDRRPTFDVKLRNVLARQPLPELLLITNRCR